jgi:tetratricopeptide (TPR) repeat protein
VTDFAMRRLAEHRLLLVMVLLCATLGAYLPAIGGGFVWDDDDHVWRNSTLRTPSGLIQIWTDIGATPQYYPLVFTTFWVEYQLWGPEPLPYHLLNVLLHAANALLLWIALRRLALPGAWLAAALFALHPVHVESVAWITERKNVLSSLFYLLGLLAYLRFEPVTDEESPEARRWGFYALALASFCLALLSKSVTCSLPAAILLLIWWKRGRLTRRSVSPTLPFFALGLAMAVVTVWTETYTIGTNKLELGLSFIDRLLIAGRAVWFYLGKLIWPAELIFMYPRWVIDATAAWQWVFPLTAVCVVLALWLARARIGRGPVVAALFFGGTLVPALGFIDVYPMLYSFVADHFQYLASIGPISALAAGGTLTWHRMTESAERSQLRLEGPWMRALGPAIAAILLALLTAQTWRQTQMYEDIVTLWHVTIDRNPGAIMARTNLAYEVRQQGRLEAATEMLRRALELDRALAHPRVWAVTHYNLGNNLWREEDFEGAIEQYENALKAFPAYAEPQRALGSLYWKLGRLEESRAAYRAYLKLRPDDKRARVELHRLRKRMQEQDRD